MIKLYPMIEFGTENDIKSIINLAEENLKERFSEQYRKEHGYITYHPAFEELKKMIDSTGIIVAYYENVLAGYILTMSREVAIKISLYNSLIENLGSFQHNGKAITDYNYMILGQVCISKNHRGKNVLQEMFSFGKNHWAENYEIGLGEIDKLNSLSYNATINKLGAIDIGSYFSGQVNWRVFLSDFR